MKPRLLPLYFEPGRDAEFDRQLAALGTLLADEAELLAPVALGAERPAADAVLFPQLLGVAYRQATALRTIDVPILLVTSEFGTLSMWDWEIAEYLRAEQIDTLGPYSLAQTKSICRALGVKRELRDTKFLVYQDDPGEGFQAPIFKRFYWWEDECSARLAARFGLQVVKRSFRALGAAAQQISDREADEAWQGMAVPAEGVSQRAARSAAKLYLAVRRELDADPTIRAAGMNCLNESHFSDTTPCLAWNALFAERGLIWGCEADTLSMLTEYVLCKSLQTPVMMTNLYPFVLGGAALKHERIERFPAVEAEPENHVLVAHCGYAGLIPQPFAARWTLRPKVLAIVDQNATAIDARMAEGPVTLAKLDPTLTKLSVAPGQLTGYAQFPGSDCRNGGVIRVGDGHRLMRGLASHHYVLLAGHHSTELRLIGKIFGLAIEEL